MALTNEDLLAISNLLDNKLKPIRDDIQLLKLQNENEMFPRLQNIESCYTSTYYRYQSGITQIEATQIDIDIVKQVVEEHSEKIQELQKKLA